MSRFDPHIFPWQGSWVNGSSYLLGDAVEYQGSAYIAIQDTVSGVVPTDQNHWEVLASQGERGDQGLAGINGVAGVQGIKGDTGAQGSKGDIGPQGPVGAAGLQGAVGGAGAQGPAGDTGPTGQQGVAGPAGEKGAQGIQGERGLGWQGSWNSAIYMTGDVVEFEGSAYIAVQDTSGGESPADPLYWDLLVRGGSSSQAFAFQGFSSGTAAGNSGYSAINGVCESEFGSGARIATTDEVLRATGLVASSGPGRAWVNGVRTGTTTRGRYQNRSVENCGGFVTNFHGVAVDRRTLDFEVEFCSASLPVACAALEPAVEYRFQGFSDSTVPGASGVLAMNAECEASFGVGARMASTEETVNAPVLVNQTGDAWVRPIRSLTDADNDEFTGQRFTNCADWSFANTTGLTVNGTAFTYSAFFTCGVGRKVACSAP